MINKKLITLIVSTLYFLLQLKGQNFYAQAIELKEWHPYSGIKSVSYVDNIIKVESESIMPLLISPDNLSIKTREFEYLIIKMKIDGSYSNGYLFFRRIGDIGFNYVNPVGIQLGLNNTYHTYIVNLTDNPNWNGVVDQLVFLPASSKGEIKIRNFSLAKKNIFLRTASICQEFLRFERPIPRMINFIYGPQINKLSVNVYIYSLIILISLFLIIFYSIKLRKLSKILNSGISKIIMICFVFWFLLDIRTALDQLRSGILDWQIFSRKSFEEKQALSTYGNYYDFYYFLKYCSSKIPTGSAFLLKIPPDYLYYKEKAKYYLYPTYEKENAEYILVFDPQKLLTSKELYNKDYREFSKFKEGQYILKRVASL